MTDAALATKSLNVLQKYSAGIAVVFFVLLNIAITPGFASTSTLWNIVIQSSSVLLVSLGITLTIATGGIDITVGPMMAFSAAIIAVLAPTSLALALAVAIVAPAAIGAMNGMIVVKFKIQPLILTLAGMFAVKGIAQVITDGRVIPISGPITDFARLRLFGVIPSQLLISVLAIAIIVFLAKRTSFGLYIEAIGESRSAARMAGLPTHLVIPAVYIGSAVLAAIAGVMQAGRLAAADSGNIGDAIHLDAIAAVAIGGANLLGGRPRVWGTVLGVLLLQLIDVMLNMNNIPYVYSLIAKAAIIIGAVYLQFVRRKP